MIFSLGFFDVFSGVYGLIWKIIGRYFMYIERFGNFIVVSCVMF